MIWLANWGFGGGFKILTSRKTEAGLITARPLFLGQAFKSARTALTPSVNAGQSLRLPEQVASRRGSPFPNKDLAASLYLEKL